MSCAVIGDSLAVGVAAMAPGCLVHARISITSRRYAQAFPLRVDADLVVISLGANDWGPGIRRSLETVRGRVAAKRVVWLIPNVTEATRRLVREVAAAHGDALLDTAAYVAGPHVVHPTARGYRRLAGDAGLEKAATPVPAQRLARR